jgi:hypothetical protein
MSKQGGEEAEVYAAMERWPESDSKRTELALIAEAIGMRWEGEPYALETGSVLAAVRRAIGGTDHE